MSLSNQHLANDLDKRIIRKFEKRKVYSSFKDNILGVDSADIQLISKCNKGIRYSLCVIDSNIYDIFSKYAWVVPLKSEKRVTIVNAFQKTLKESNRKPYKIWVDQGSEFCNSCFEKWLKDNDIEIYSKYNEGKSVVVERFIRTLKSKIYKHMTAISKNLCFDVLDDIVNEYDNTYYRTIKIKPIDVNSDCYAESKDAKFKVGTHVRISKYKKIFARGYTSNCSEEIFVISKIKNTVP